MTREEFIPVLVYLSAATGKEVTTPTAEVYFDLLGDLPLLAVEFAVKRALLESKYPTLPTVGVIRDLAAEAMADQSAMAPAEAWRLALRAADVLACTYDFIGRELRAVVQERTLQQLPDAVRRAGEAIGWRALADSTNPDATRAHFCKAFEQVSGRQRREALLPGPMRQLLAKVVSPLPSLEFQ